METKCLQTTLEAHGDLRNSIHIAEHSLPVHPRRKWTNVLIQIHTNMMVNVLFHALTKYRFLFLFIVCRNFRVLAEHCSRYSGSINLMVLLGFFTSTAMQRLYSMQTPETDQSITVFILSLKPNLPEVSPTLSHFSLYCNDFNRYFILKGPVIIDQFVRWQLLCLILSFCVVSQPLRKIYPNLTSLQTAGSLMIRPFFFRLPCYFVTINIYIFQSRITNSRRKAVHRRLSFD